VPVLGNRASFWTAGAVVALALWASASPTMVYPLYQADWHVSTTTVTWIFAAYPLALIPVLVVFGDLSDHIGRRASIALGLTAELVGVLLFAIAADVTWLLAGRALMGLGVGLSISPASVAMVEFSPLERRDRAGAVSTAVSALGIALAMVGGGALTEYAPFPLRLNFVVLAVAIVIVGGLVLKMPRHTHGETRQRWRVRPIVIPRGSRTVFVAGSMAFASSFLLGAIVLPLGAKIAQQLAGSTNALLTGALLSVFAACITIFSLLARRMDMWISVMLGATASIVAVWLFVLTGAAHSLTVFFLASACAGAAYAFDYAGGLNVFSFHAAPHHRASMTSGGFLVGYIAQGIAAPVLGWVVTRHGLMTGLLTGGTVFGLFFLATLVSGTAIVLRRRATRVAPTGIDKPETVSAAPQGARS
jgi:MFS family permease